MNDLHLILSSQFAFELLRRQMSFDAEEFWVIALDSEKKPIASKCLFRGTVDACLIHPRDIFRFVCLANASSFLVAHNHPSGNLHPSPQDERLTRKIYRCSQLFEIPVVDHLIITQERFFSFRDEGISPFGRRPFNTCQRL